MQITTQLSADDYRDFLDLVVSLDKIRRRARWVGTFLCVMLFFVVLGVSRFVWALASGYQTGVVAELLDRPYLLALVIVGLLLIPIAVLCLRSAAPLLGRLFATGKTGDLDEACLRDGVNIGVSRFDLNSDGVRESLAKIQSFYAWEAFQGLRETDRNLYLVIDAGSAFIVPKRAFPDDTSLQAFKALAMSQIGAAI